MNDINSVRVRLMLSLGQATLFVALTGLPSLAWSQAVPALAKANEVEFAYIEHPPVMFTNAQGLPDGTLVKLGAALLKNAGIPSRFVSYPAPRLFNNLETGTSQMSILIRSPGSENCCLLGKESISGDEIKVLYFGGKTPISSREDLVGKSIITIRGYTYGGISSFIDDPKNRITREIAGTQEAAYDMLRLGRADYLLDLGLTSRKFLAIKPAKNLKEVVVARTYAYIAVSKAYPNAEKLLEQLEAALKTIDKDGILTPAAR